MSTNENDSTLDCQTCGTMIRKLTHAEAQQVAYAPYNFIVDCGVCQRLMQKRWSVTEDAA